MKLTNLTHKNKSVQSLMLFNQLSDATIKFMDSRFYRELRLSYIKYFALKGLVDNDGTSKHSDIAALTNTKKHNITALVKRMGKEGLVTTEYSKVDRRVNNITITDKGRQAYEKANVLYLEMVKHLMNGLKDIELEGFEKVLDKVKGNLES